MYDLVAALVLSSANLAVAKSESSGNTIVVRELPEQYEDETGRQIYHYRLSVVNTDGRLVFDHNNKYEHDFEYDLKRVFPEEQDTYHPWFSVGYTSLWK